MAETGKRSIRRFLKRNFLYILLLIIALALVALIVWGAVSIFRQLADVYREDSGETQTTSDTHIRPSVPVTEAPKEDETDTTEPNTEPDTPEDPAQEQPSGWMENGQFVQPFNGTTVLLEGRRVALTYDETQLQKTEENGVVSLSGLGGEDVPRLDIQRLNSTLYRLSDEEITRLAIGILQAYYVDAPDTESVTVVDSAGSSNDYTFTLSAPQTDGVPPMRADLHFFQTEDEFWYAVLLRTEQDEAAAFVQAFENIKIK